MDFAGENVRQFEEIATPKHFTPMQLSIGWLSRVQSELQAVADIQVAVEVQLALANMSGVAQLRERPLSTLDHGLEVGEVQEVGTIEIDVRAGREIKHS